MNPDDFDLNKLTPENEKKIAQILSKARWSLVWIGVKFSIGLCLSNVFCLAIAAIFFKDAEVETIQNFALVSMVLNFIFMTTYLNRQFKNNSDIVKKKIQEILKKDN